MGLFCFVDARPPQFLPSVVQLTALGLGYARPAGTPWLAADHRGQIKCPIGGILFSCGCLHASHPTHIRFAVSATLRWSKDESALSTKSALTVRCSTKIWVIWADLCHFGPHVQHLFFGRATVYIQMSGVYLSFGLKTS